MRPDDLVGALGRFLRRVHAEPPAADADTVDVATALAAASRAVAEQRMGADDLVDPYRGQTPARLLEIAIDLSSRLEPGRAPAPTTVHGALRLDGVLIDGGEVVGWPSTPPRAGDPYVDLVALALDLSVAVGPGAVPALVDATGIDRPDPVRIEVWCLLRQLAVDVPTT